MFFREAGWAKKAAELITIVLSTPVAIEIALLSLNLLYKLSLALPERIYSQTLGDGAYLMHFHRITPFT
jgi:hypothetical protein